MARQGIFPLRSRLENREDNEKGLSSIFENVLKKS